MDASPFNGAFDDITPIGELPIEDVAAQLREIGATEDAEAILAGVKNPQESFGVKSFVSNFYTWRHGSHCFGFIPPVGDSPAQNLEIYHPGQIPPNETLKNTRIVVTLDRLRIKSYPGFGQHQIMFEFYGQHQVRKKAEDLHFNLKFEARDGDDASYFNYPIFVGLKVGAQGVNFDCLTINVKNNADEKFIGFLDSDVFRSGLKLATTAQPAIAPFSAMAVALTRSIAQRNKNQVVQRFSLGLDFSDNATRARLAIGSYIAVQVPSSSLANWDWTMWKYNRANGQIVDNNAELIPFNYVVFSVSQYIED